MKPLLCAVLLLGVATALFGCSAEEPAEVWLRILAVNDFHGNIAVGSDPFGGEGWADYLAARAEVDHSVFVSSGDLISASPLISALFHDSLPSRP